jgi:hypothetical protein
LLCVEQIKLLAVFPVQQFWVFPGGTSVRLLRKAQPCD